MTLPILSLIIAITCYAIRELYYHKKLRWTKNTNGFWGTDSWVRKYKSYENNGVDFVDAPTNWYYKFNNDLRYKEKFPLSGTILVFVTDGPHFFQMLFFTFLSLSVVLFIGWSVWIFITVMIGLRLVNWATRKIFSK